MSRRLGNNLVNFNLAPGMAVTVEIKTGSRTVISYRKNTLTSSRVHNSPLRPSSWPLRPPEPHARASAILVDEFDTSGLKGKSYYFESCSTRVAHSGFDLTDSHNANSGPIGKVLLRPIEESAGCPAL
jgi:hypothetical protein